MTSITQLRPQGAQIQGNIEQQMRQVRWRTVNVKVSDAFLKEHFTFLNTAVVLRSGREGVPLMTTSGIFGAIEPGQKVRLTPGEGAGVEVLEEKCAGRSLIDELEEKYHTHTSVREGSAVCVNAKWISVKDGGAIPGLGGSANVFGGTGSLLVNDPMLQFPVLDTTHPHYEETLAYYGGKLLKPREKFFMGFDEILYGMQYDGRLPDYISGYALQPFGGGGLFVEHHPFPHIFLPQPAMDGQPATSSKILLGRLIEDAHKHQPYVPAYHFTIFRVPADGSALTIRPNTIHNDSFTSGPETVYLADTPANTVALRQTAPYQNLMAVDVDDAPSA
ncbi:hypothetical protein [Kordiimonas sp.]|uniref:hypothetical protein n=1 Tax=Kordiimonas sp. TaxID=1970157 RepID=UPI003A9152CC